MSQQYQIDIKPPQALDLEINVLGALLLESHSWTEVSAMLSPGVFFVEKHALIYRAISDLHRRGEPADISTVTVELRKMGKLEFVGGAYFISQLTNNVASSANIEYHSRILVQQFLRRELIRISSDSIRRAYDPTVDVFEAFDGLHEADRLLELAVSNGRKILSMAEGVRLERKNYEAMEAAVMEGRVTGIDTGFEDLNRILGGWQKSDLIILAARPGMGKTSLLLAFAVACAVLAGKKMLIFSLEMSALQLVQRLVQMLSGVDSLKYRRAKLNPLEKEIVENEARAKLEKMGIYIDDTPGIKVSYMRTRVRRFKQEHGDDILVATDYLGLHSPEEKGQVREQQITQISADLKRCAKENDVPVIALSQLSRAVETRGGDKRPQLSDLRDSGSVEQDADIVMFIYRPAYYGFKGPKGESLDDVAEIIIAKHRNGAIGSVELRYIDHLTKFEDPYKPQPGDTAGIQTASAYNDDLPF